MTILISQYPVTNAYISKLSKIVGEPIEPIIVSKISKEGYLSIIRLFWKIETNTVLVPVIDESSKPLLPPMQILSLLIKARHRKAVLPDLSFREFGLLDGFIGGMKMLFGMLDGVLTVFWDQKKLTHLSRAERIPIREFNDSRVLYLKTNLWLGVQAGGAVAHTSGVIKGMLERGCDIDCISVETPIALPDDPKLRIRRFPPQKTYIIPRELNHYRHNSQLINELDTIRLDVNGVIYQRLSLGNYTGVLLSRKHKVPLIIEYNGSENWLADNWGTPLSFKKLSAQAENTCIFHAHLIVTVSDALKEELIGRGVEPERIVSCPNGVDPLQFNSDDFCREEKDSVRAQYGIDKDALVITFVGTFGPWHGAEILARTIARLADEGFLSQSGNFHFMFIGDGVRRELVEKIIDVPIVRDSVTLTGLVEQVETPLHLAASDILISPHIRNPDGSEFFGSPTKLFEYLSAGRPVIASDLGQIGKIMEGSAHINDIENLSEKEIGSGCGVLVTPESIEELSAAIKYLVGKEKLRNSMGVHARQRVLKSYTWKSHVDTIFNSLQSAQALDEKPLRKPVKVLLNGLHSKSGGGLTYLNNILPLMANDPEIELHLCIHEDQRALLKVNLDNINLHTFNFPQKFWRLHWGEQMLVPKLCAKLGVDVTFSPANYGPIFARNPVILLRNALSVAFVERRPLKLAYWALVYLGTFASLLRAKRVISVSNFAKSAASGGLSGFFSNAVIVIPHGVSKKFRPSSQKKKRENFLLAVSDIYVQKNYINLILAFSKLIKETPDLHLKIAGSPIDLDYFNKLERLIDELGLRERITFVGRVGASELVELYQNCSVFVFPSTVETFGNPLIEAMACGAPIASANTAAMPEVVGDAAIFFNPRDVDSMSKAIVRILTNKALQNELSQKSTERAKLFSWEDSARKTLEVIKSASGAYTAETIYQKGK